MNPESVEAEWEAVGNDPDPAEDLGYLLLELEFIHSNSRRDQVIVLPKEESLLKEDAFVVVGADDIVELQQHR